MEKLIELLNEYEKESGLDLSRYSYTDNEHDLEGKLDKLSELKPFIKWLVENEKIDLNDIQDCFYVRSYNKEGIAKKYEYYEELLMLLAVQDNPIDFLSSILM